MTISNNYNNNNYRLTNQHEEPAQPVSFDTPEDDDDPWKGYADLLGIADSSQVVIEPPVEVPQQPTVNPFLEAEQRMQERQQAINRYWFMQSQNLQNPYYQSRPYGYPMQGSMMGNGYGAGYSQYPYYPNTMGGYVRPVDYTV